MFDQDFIQKMKQRLLDEKADIERKIADIKKPEQNVDNPEMDDVAFDATEDILEESMLNSFKHTQEKVAAALERVAAGAYGVGVNTGKEISRERLESEPWAEDIAPINKND